MMHNPIWRPLFPACFALMIATTSAIIPDQPIGGTQTGGILNGLNFQDTAGGNGPNAAKCEPLSLPMCSSLGLYNTTRLPNFFGQTSQKEAGLEVNQFWPLLKINCSPMLGFFLCSLYVPVCLANYEKVLPPCRSVCEIVRSGCGPVMGKYGFPWPDKLNCSAFPQNDGGASLCMGPPPKEALPSPGSVANPFAPGSDTSVPGMPTNLNGHLLPGLMLPEQDHESTILQRPSRPEFSSNNPILTSGSKCADIIRRPPSCSCDVPFIPVEPTHHPYRRLFIAGSAVPDCAYPCASPFFSASEHRFAFIWVSGCAIVSFTASALTLATFALDPARWRYPERAIFFMAAAYLIMSFGYIVHLALGRDQVACVSPRTSGGFSGHNDGINPGYTDSITSHYLQSGGKYNAACPIVFLLVYIGGMAAGAWWVLLSLTWFLSAALKWSAEAITKKATWFHVVGWGAPIVQACLVLVLAAVDGDPVAGICYVGATSLSALRWAVIAPLTLHLGLGSIFLFLGFFDLVRIRRFLGKQPIGGGGLSGPGPLEKASTEKFKLLMVRLGLFSLLYALPAGVVLGAHFYEEHYRSRWEASIACNVDKLAQAAQECLNQMALAALSASSGQIDSTAAQRLLNNPDFSTSSSFSLGSHESFSNNAAVAAATLNYHQQRRNYRERPEFGVFLLKYCMQFLAGVSPILWICSRKTAMAWFQLLCCRAVPCCATGQQPGAANTPDPDASCCCGGGTDLDGDDGVCAPMTGNQQQQQHFGPGPFHQQYHHQQQHVSSPPPIGPTPVPVMYQSPAVAAANVVVGGEAISAI